MRFLFSFLFSHSFYSRHNKLRKGKGHQAVTKGLSSTSKFSGSCVPTLQTLPPRDRGVLVNQGGNETRLMTRERSTNPTVISYSKSMMIRLLSPLDTTSVSMLITSRHHSTCRMESVKERSYLHWWSFLLTQLSVHLVPVLPSWQ